MSTFSFAVEDPDGQGSLQRLDKYLASRKELKGVSRSNLQEVIGLGRVAVNNVKRTKPSFRLKPGVRVIVDLDTTQSVSQEEIGSNLIQGGDGLSLLEKLEMAQESDAKKDYSKYIVGEALPLDVVHEDTALLVVNKARGMAVHASVETNSRFQGTLVNALLHHCGGRQGLSSGEDSGGYRPGIVHRIDMNTSGLLVVAKTDEAHALLKKQFMTHSIEREYICLCHGSVSADSGSIASMLGKDVSVRARQAVLRELSDEEAASFLAARERQEPAAQTPEVPLNDHLAGEDEESDGEDLEEDGKVAISRFTVLGRYQLPVVTEGGQVMSKYVDTQQQKKAPLSKKQKRRQARELMEHATENGAVTLVKMKLETGRTHQIRAHMHYLGHSLLFDPLYRKNYRPPPARSSFAPSTVFTPEEMFVMASSSCGSDKDTWNGQLLHAASLAFRHPASGELVSFASEPAEPLHGVLHRLSKYKQ